MKRTSNNPGSSTESSRLMRGADRTDYEYILELLPEDKVGVDGVAHDIAPEYCDDMSKILAKAIIVR